MEFQVKNQVLKEIYFVVKADFSKPNFEIPVLSSWQTQFASRLLPKPLDCKVQ